MSLHVLPASINTPFTSNVLFFGTRVELVRTSVENKGALQRAHQSILQNELVQTRKKWQYCCRNNRNRGRNLVTIVVSTIIKKTGAAYGIDDRSDVRDFKNRRRVGDCLTAYSTTGTG